MTELLTPQELESIQHLHRETPYAIYHVSEGMFSLARYYGGITYNDSHYRYIPEHDACVRDDVWRLVEKLRKLERKKAKTPKVEQPQLEGME